MFTPLDFIYRHEWSQFYDEHLLPPLIGYVLHVLPTSDYWDVYWRVGASTGSVDLLPNAVASKPHGVSKLSKDDGKESDQIYSFDGKTNVVEVPTTTFNHTLSTHFTISLWMKHSPSGQEAQKKHGKKEQILCNSDSESTYLLTSPVHSSVVPRS